MAHTVVTTRTLTVEYDSKGRVVKEVTVTVEDDQDVQDDPAVQQDGD
jgi:outer membrane protein assembly factor BamE (lipoprotein component of BamABCDE complex)